MLCREGGDIARIRYIHGHDFRYTRLDGQPIKRCIGEIHLALACFAVATHPSNDVRQIRRVKWINHRPAKLNPPQHFKSLRHVQ